MDASQIVAGKVYDDRDGIGCYVVELVPAEGRKLARVTWRRIGGFAPRIETETMPKFLSRVTRLSKDQHVQTAPHLPNKGMALQPTGQHKGNE